VDTSRLALRVEELYDTLPAAQRAAMGLVDFDGYTPAQAAEMMAVAPGTLRVNLSKARASVRRRLLAGIPELAVRLAGHGDD
jgi:DNA-directed RNA polymerase specialized sigma24 family protein